MRNFYAVGYRETTEGKYYSMILRFNQSMNLVSFFSSFKAVTMCATKKEAERIRKEWDANFLANGEYGGLIL